MESVKKRERNKTNKQSAQESGAKRQDNRKNNFGKIKGWNFLGLFLAGCINASGVILMLYPAALIDGGISGLSMVLGQKTELAVSIFLVALNLPLFLFGLKKMGFRFILYSLAAIAAYSLTAFLFQFFKVDAVIFKAMKEDRLLCCIFGGLLSGVGSGLTIRCGGAIDGIEVLAVMFAKRIGLSVGQFVMIFNMAVYILGGALMADLAVCLYSVVAYMVGLKVVDFVVDGFDKGKACFIVTRDSEHLARVISTEMGRGITEVDCKGFYLKENNKLLYCVVNRFEITQLKNIIARTDPQAFVSISEVSEVSGNRIRFTPKRRKKVSDVLKESGALAEESVEVAAVAETAVFDGSDCGYDAADIDVSLAADIVSQEESTDTEQAEQEIT